MYLFNFEYGFIFYAFLLKCFSIELLPTIGLSIDHKKRVSKLMDTLIFYGN